MRDENLIEQAFALVQLAIVWAARFVPDSVRELIRRSNKN